MVKLAGIIGRLQPRKVLVVGDLILDKYTMGKANRISPEAPVPVLHVSHEEQKPGGAGNVMVNLISLGAEVVALGRIGHDAAGEELLQVLGKEGINTSAIYKQQGYPTPVKNRIIASNQQIVRVDNEITEQLPEMLEEEQIKLLPSLLSDIDVIAISDYGKGSVTPTLLQAIYDEAQRKKIPVISDPKGTDFARYTGSTILKPNKGEAYAAANLPSSAPIENVAKALFEKASVDVIMITRSDEGISLFYQNGQQEHYAVEAMEIKDVTGAGDTVLAMMSFAVANKLTYGEATRLANVAAGITINYIGCARVTLSMLAKRLLELDSHNKIFEDDHLFALGQILSEKSFNVLPLKLDKGLNETHLDSIRRFSEQDAYLVISLQEPLPSETMVQFLSSIQGVDFIVLGEKNLDSICALQK